MHHRYPVVAVADRELAKIEVSKDEQIKGESENKRDERDAEQPVSMPGEGERGASRASDSVDTVSMNEAPTVGTIRLRKTVTTRPSHSARAITNSTIPAEYHPSSTRRVPSTAVPATPVRAAGDRASTRKPAWSRTTRATRITPRAIHAEAAINSRIRDSASWSSKKRATDTIPVPITTAPEAGGITAKMRSNAPRLLVARFDGISEGHRQLPTRGWQAAPPGR